MSSLPDSLLGVVAFDWDDENRDKNWLKHGVRWSEAEEVFTQGSPKITRDEQHSKAESRYAAWGATSRGRRLTVVFTIRQARIRVISARDMSRTERRQFDEQAQTEADPEVR